MALGIMALLLAAPSFSRQVDDSHQRSYLFELRRLVQLARSNALGTGRETTLCGTQNGVDCRADWEDGAIIVFEDRDRNRKLGATDRLIFESTMPRARWHWRGSNRPYLRFAGNGSVLEKGHFTLCPNRRGGKTAGQLIVNWVGRVRTTTIARSELAQSESCE